MPKDLQGASGYATYDQGAKWRWNLKIVKGVLNRGPIQAVISFGEINFDGHGFDFTFRIGDRVGYFFDKNDIIHNTPSRDEAGLARTNTLTQEMFQLINQ